MSNEENINYEEEINNINKKINEIINNILDGHSFKWLTTKEYSDLDEESKNNSNIEYHIVDMNYLLESENGEKFILKVDDNGQLFTEKYIEIFEIEDIYLNEYSITLVVGESFELISTVTPDNATDKSLIWESSNEEIVRIERGIIYALSQGDAIISISSRDKRIKKECTVKVIKDLVKDGLLCHIDAMDFNENKINDKNNNISFVVVGDPILQDKYLYFDGVNDMLYTPRIKELLKDYTISVVFNELDLVKYCIENKGTPRVIWNGSDFRGYAAICIYASRINDDQYQIMTGRYTILPPKVYYNGYLSSSSDFVNIDICIDVVNGKYTVYKNGIKIGSNMLEESIVNTNFIVIGGMYTDKPYLYSYSNIGSLKVYNRILSEDEIISNYEYERNIRG